MRIDCEQCGAAYSIDDALITERGVRAQCPKCAHQKVVKKPAPGAAGPVTSMMPRAELSPPTANPFAPPSSAGANPFAPPPMANPFGQAPVEATQTNANPFATATQPGPPPSMTSGNPFGQGGPQSASQSGGAPLGGMGTPPPSFASAPSPFGASAGASPFGASPAPSPFDAGASAPPFGASASPSPFGAAPPFGAAAPFAASPTTGAQAAPFGANANPFGAAAPSPFGQSSPPSAANNPFTAPGFGAAQPQGAVNPFAPPPTTSSSPFGGGGGAGDPFAQTQPPQAADPFGSNNRGAPMQDPFGALGAAPARTTSPPTAADPFAKLDAPTFGASSARPAMNMPSGGAPGARSADGPKRGGDPFATPDPSSPHDPFGGQAIAPGAKADDPFAKLDLDAGKPSRPDPARPEPSRADGTSAPRKPPPAKVSAARGSGAGGRNRPSFGMIAGIVGVVVVVGGGALTYLMKPELFEKNTDAGVNPLRRAKPSWEKQFPDVSGTAQEHVTAGRAQMHLDTAAGYRKADDELRQALLLDIGNVNAIGAWVENFTYLPAVKADIEGAALAGEAVAYARKKDPTNVDVMRAEGALKLALGDVDPAQKVLVAAHTQAPGNADTTLVLAASHLDRNPQDAFDLVQEVRTKDPSLKHALVVEGAAQRRLGAFKEARDVLGARLADDPANTGALKELAKLDLDIGDPELAIAALSRLLQAEDRDVEAHLMRAKIAYQSVDTVEGLKRADGYLDIVLKNHDTSAGELLLPVLTHAAYVKAELGNLDEALRLAERARATQSDYAPALFVLGRIQALKGNLDEAKKRLEESVRAASARDTFYEPVARAELARVLGLSGDTQNATRNYEQVIEYDPRYTRAHFGLAATYMATDKATQAMTIIRRAFENDPGFESDRHILTDYPTPKHDLLAFADVFKNAKVPPGDESLAALKLAAEGMIRYSAGQVAEAEALERRTLIEDHYCDVALLYLGVIELNDGRVQEAHKHLRQAVDITGKNHAMTRLYLARAETRSNELDGARTRLQDLIDQEPTLVQAQYSLAMLMRQQHLEAQAVDVLKKVIKADPDFQPAKRALAE